MILTNNGILASSYYWHPISVNYFNRAGITDYIEKRSVNNFVLSCKLNANIWNSLQGGAVYLISPTSYGASLHNLMSSNFLMTPGVSPAYSTNGFSFNGSTMYLKTGLIPSINMSLYTGFTLMYIRSAVATNTITSGANDGTNSYQTSVISATNFATFNAYNGATLFTGSNPVGAGIYTFNILSNVSRSIRKSSSLLNGSAASMGGTLPNLEIYIGSRNLNGIADLFSQFETSTHIQGLIGLSDSDIDTLTSYVQIYNQQVITGGR